MLFCSCHRYHRHILLCFRCTGPWSWWCFPYDRFNGKFSKQQVTDVQLKSQHALRYRIEQIVSGMVYSNEIRLPYDDSLSIDLVSLPAITLSYLKSNFIIDSDLPNISMITMDTYFVRGYKPLLNVGSLRNPYFGDERCGFIWSKGCIEAKFQDTDDYTLFYNHLCDFLLSKFRHISGSSSS